VLLGLNLTGPMKADTLMFTRSAQTQPLRRNESMHSNSQTDSRRWIRRIGGISAVILLLAQTVGVAHFHPLPSRHNYLATAAVSVDDGLCALCLVRFHSPAALVVVPHTTALAQAESHVPCGTNTAPLPSYRPHRFGRAPPASV
jgi:hypothetical protein